MCFHILVLHLASDKRWWAHSTWVYINLCRFAIEQTYQKTSKGKTHTYMLSKMYACRGFFFQPELTGTQFRQLSDGSHCHYKRTKEVFMVVVELLIFARAQAWTRAQATTARAQTQVQACCARAQTWPRASHAQKVKNNNQKLKIKPPKPGQLL